ncbi:hypothetical protein [Tychonema sp. BBK16]|uniref:hypothetical protein n=1 Tax=Tychonema sp. BBK16 TaxID=2699888 RepID=UPI001F21FC2A|nr:hypothetical protein [Tychonema sp. BBK16]MCF6374477.1 hypothetical protein [Tychonema sp. BBK16]
MKVIQKTEDILELDDREEGSFMAIIFTGFGMNFLGFILLIMTLVTISAPGVERLSCKKIERTIATCEISTSSVMGLVKGESTSIEGVQKAKVDTINSTNSEGNSTSKQQMSLVTKQESITLADRFSGEDAELFNKYIQTAVGGLIIEKDDRLYHSGMMLFFVMFSFVAAREDINILRRKLIRQNYTFDKNKNTLTINKNWLWMNQVTERSLCEIVEVKLKAVKVNKTEDDSHTYYEVCLLMNAGDILCLSSSWNPGEQKEMADLIRSYIEGRSPIFRQ